MPADPTYTNLCFANTPTEREERDAVEQAEITASWFFDRATRPQKARFNATMESLRGTVGPRWTRERARAHANYAAETRQASRLYDEAVEQLLSTGEISEELDEMWTALIDAAEGREADRSSDEVEARAKGWVTEQEMHGVNDHHGVVHPDGLWAPDWKLACKRESA